MHVNEPGLASFYMEKWLLSADGPAIQTPTSSLFPVVKDGVALMLKIIKSESDEQNSCTALQHYNGQGAVKVFERADEAFVMQRADPGKTLVVYRQEYGDAEATGVVAEVLARLHGVSAPIIASDLPPLQILQGSLATTLKSEQRVLSQAMLMYAEALFEKLIASTRYQVVLHGDLHHENVLFDSKGGWLAIDPKGFIGDPIYDCAALFKNPLHDESIMDKQNIFARAQIFQDQLGYPSERILEWAFVHCVLSVIWSLQDGVETGPALPVAETLFKTLRNS